MERYLFLYEEDFHNGYEFIEAENVTEALIKFYDYCGGHCGGYVLTHRDFAVLARHDFLRGVEIFNQINDSYINLQYILNAFGSYLYNYEDREGD